MHNYVVVRLWPRVVYLICKGEENHEAKTTTVYIADRQWFSQYILQAGAFDLLARHSRSYVAGAHEVSEPFKTSYIALINWLHKHCNL